MFICCLLYIVTPCLITAVATLFTIFMFRYTRILPCVVCILSYPVLYISTTYLVVFRYDLLQTETRFPLVNDMDSLVKAVRTWIKPCSYTFEQLKCDYFNFFYSWKYLMPAFENLWRKLCLQFMKFCAVYSN